MSLLIKSCQLSCDVYKSKNALLKNYASQSPRVISYKNSPLALATYSGKQLNIVFRGCKNIDEIVECINTKVKKPFLNKQVYINSGFLTKYDQIHDELREILKDYAAEDVQFIVFSGHSLGGALAQLACAFNNIDNIVYCHTFGSPFVGDNGFKNLVECNVDEHKRCVVKQDIIPKIKFNSCLVHNGMEIELDSKSKVSFPLNLYDHHTCNNYLKCLRSKKL